MLLTIKLKVLFLGGSTKECG